jgi:hypothetical protein
MKNSTFVKFLFAALAIGTLIGSASCKKTPACEKENFGTVVIINHTGMDIWVDCTPEGEDYNEERFLANGDSTKYRMIPGQVTEWAIEESGYPSGSWYSDSYYLEQCEVHRDPWTNSKSAKVGSKK